MSTGFEIPTLHTERTVLRAFRPGDLEPLSAMNADPLFRRWLGGRLLSRTESWGVMETALGQWALRGYGLFAVDVAGRFAGRVGLLHPLDWPEPELAWGLAPAFWGQGLAAEASAAARDWAFRQLRFGELASFILVENARSRRVAEKLGAVRQGTVEIRGLVAERWVHPAPGRGAVV